MSILNFFLFASIFLATEASVASDGLSGKSFCFPSEGPRASIMEYSFYPDGEGTIRGYKFLGGPALFEDPIGWQTKEDVVTIVFPDGYYYRKLRARTYFGDGIVVFDWLDTAHPPTEMSFCP